MTEVPEHLLQRSRERRKALGLPVAGEEGGAAPAPAAGGDEAPVPAAAAAAPAARTAPAPAPAAPPPPPKPLPPYVVAAQTRKRIPVWAMPVLAALPLWAYVFATTLSPPSLGENDPLVIGRNVYRANCASCHGATGGGGVGPAMTNGDVLLTFPNAEDHIAWIEGGEGAANEDGTYGDPDRPGGVRNVDTFSGQMPGFADVLSPEEIAAVVRYERETLGGGDPEPELTDPAAAAAAGEEGGEGGEAEAGGGGQTGGGQTGTPTTADDGTGSGSDDTDGQGGETDTEGGEGSTEDTTGTGGD